MMAASDDNPLGISILWSCSPFPVPHKDLPPKLWHVRHGQSQSLMTYGGGFTAAASRRSIRDDADLRLQASRHFDWDTHLYEETRDWKSCFISVFGDRYHAENWGRKRKRPVAIYEIDVTKLSSSTIVFDSVKLCELLEIKDHPWAKNEFLFLGRIPGHWVMDKDQLVGREYIRQPNWRVSDIPRSRKLGPHEILDLSGLTNSVKPYPTSQARDRRPVTVLNPSGLKTWPKEYPTSQSCDGHGDLPMESANTEDDVDGLVNSFNDALHLNIDAPTPTSNTSNSKR